MKIRFRQPSYVGHDGLDRSLRYVEWATEPDTEDTSYTVDFAYLLRDASGFRIEQDQDVFGLFSEATWLRLLREEGFQFKVLTDSLQTRKFIGVKKGDVSVI